jgi:hypothetical protein
VAFFLGHEYPRVHAVERIEIIDMKKTVNEFFDAEQIKGGRRDEKNWCLVATKVSQDVGQTAEFWGSSHAYSSQITALSDVITYLTSLYSQ